MLFRIWMTWCHFCAFFPLSRFYNISWHPNFLSWSTRLYDLSLSIFPSLLCLKLSNVFSASGFLHLLISTQNVCMTGSFFTIKMPQKKSLLYPPNLSWFLSNTLYTMLFNYLTTSDFFNSFFVFYLSMLEYKHQKLWKIFSLTYPQHLNSSWQREVLNKCLLNV